MIEVVAKTANLETKARAGRVVDVVFAAIRMALKSGDEVRIAGFGKFFVKERAAREGRNPKTGEKVQIAASKKPKFRAGKEFKEAVQ